MESAEIVVSPKQFSSSDFATGPVSLKIGFQISHPIQKKYSPLLHPDSGINTNKSPPCMPSTDIGPATLARNSPIQKMDVSLIHSESDFNSPPENVAMGMPKICYRVIWFSPVIG